MFRDYPAGMTECSLLAGFERELASRFLFRRFTLLSRNCWLALPCRCSGCQKKRRGFLQDKPFWGGMSGFLQSVWEFANRKRRIQEYG